MMRIHKLRLSILSILFLVSVISAYVAFREDRKGMLTVAFLDVGQGDSIFIEAPSGNQMLIDGGPGKPVLRELSKVMPFYDRSIDVVLATHADQDHVGGLPDVMKKYDTDLLLESGVAGDSSSYNEVEKMVDDSGKINKILVKKGMVVDLGGGATLQILFPDRDPSGMETNTSSVVIRLTYGESGFLFTGDSPKNIEDYLALNCQGRPLASSACSAIKSDVLKVSHHGSKASTGAAFISAVSPQYAVISVGKDNKYGHPNQEVLDILNNFGAKILRTDQSGRVVFKSDGSELKIKN